MKALINYFKIFYKWIGIKFFLFAFLVLSTTLIESLGFTIALPILEYGSDPEESSRYSIFIYKLLESINIEVSIVSLVILVIFLFVVKAIIRLIQVNIGLKIVYNFLQDLRIDLIEHYRKIGIEDLLVEKKINKKIRSKSFEMKNKDISNNGLMFIDSDSESSDDAKIKKNSLNI